MRTKDISTEAEPIKLGVSAGHNGLRTTIRGVVSIVALTCLCLSEGPTQAADNIVFEASNTIRAGTSTYHAVRLASAGNYVIKLSSAKLDLSLIIATTDRDPTTYDNPLFRDDDELVFLAAESAMSIDISVTSKEFADVTAPYRLTVSQLDANASGHHMRATAYAALSAASRVQEPALHSDAQIAFLSEAANSFRKLGELRLEAQALYSIAMTHYWRSLDVNRAAMVAADAAVRYRELGLEYLYANCLQLQAASIIEQANAVPKTTTRSGVSVDARRLFDHALALFAEALAIQMNGERDYDVAQITNNIGLTYHYMNDWENAAAHYQRAAEIFQSHGEWAGELNPRANLSVIDFELGKLRDARRELNRLLQLLPPGQENEFRADELDNLAAVNLELANYDDALHGFSLALKMHRKLKDAKGAGRSLSGIGTTYSALGRHDLAARYLDEALDARRDASDGRGQLATLRQIGRLHRHNRQWQAAVAADLEALELATAPSDRAAVLVSLARDYVGLDDTSLVDRVLQDAQLNADQARSPPLIATVALAKGDAMLRRGQAGDALEHLTSAQRTFAALHIDQLNADALRGLALVASQQGQYRKAIAHMDTALSIVERVRAAVGSPQLRANFFAQRQLHFETAIDILMAASANAATLDRASMLRARALETSERSKSRLLRDRLSQGSLAMKRQSDAQREQYAALAEARYQFDQLLDKQSSSDTFDAVALSRVARRLDAIENDIALLAIKDSHTQDAGDQQASFETFDVDQFMQQLRPGELVLHYFVGTEISYRWAITHDGISAWPLPGRDTIEPQALAAYRSFLRPNVDRGSVLRANDARSLLSGTLFGALTEFQDVRSVTIIADEALQLVPFGALAWPLTDGSRIPLLEAVHLKTTPSATVAAQVQRAAMSRPAPAKTIAVFANPVYSRFDERLPPSKMPRSDGNQPADLPSLPFSGQEAEEILNLVGEQDATIMLGPQASASSFNAIDIDDYRIVHIAAHTSIDAIYPALSTIFFSDYDAVGDEVDGALRLFNLQQRTFNAELVVLSACSTALGKNIRGEGLIGPAHAFMSAGAQGIVASLWPVPDKATAVLMAQFYEQLLVHGDSAPTALRIAQRSLKDTLRWRDPYYWAAFVYVGI